MNVKPPSPPIPNVSFHVKISAIIIAAIMVTLPVQTNFFSSASFDMYFLNMSNVKMVEMLLAFPAREATIAAVNAAIDKPFKPAGKNPRMAE